MPTAVVDMTGERVGLWLVLGRSIRRLPNATRRAIYWRVVCEGCGHKSDVSGTSMRAGRSTGCRHCRSKQPVKRLAYCLRCGTLHRRLKYCSVECMKLATTEKRRLWWAANKAEINADRRKNV